MSYYEASTIRDTIPISTALMWKVRNPGLTNSFVESCLRDCIRNETDKKIISVCEQFIDEIYDMRRNAYNGKWTWRYDTSRGSFEETYANLICMIVGCWPNYDSESFFFYVNQNHQQWLSW